MMVIAREILSIFDDFLDDPAGILSEDAKNFDRANFENKDLDDPALAYLSPGALPDPRKGCIIGVIDDAIPFAHERFTLPGNLSRVASVWLQDARFRPGMGVDLPTGAEWRGAELSGLLDDLAQGRIPDEDAIYRRTGAVDLTRPAPPSGAYETGHGAAVAPLAAGFDPSDPQARNHPLIAVCLPPRITADSMGVLAPVPIMAGIVFIIKRARRLCRFIEARENLKPGSVRLPVVINLSLGLTAGPRDGQSPLERFMDAVIASEPSDLGRVHIVLPSGNHRQGRLRARLQPGQGIEWRLPADDMTINAIEIWGPPYAHPPQAGLQVTLTVPGLAPATTAFTAPFQASVLTGRDGRRLAQAYYTPNQMPDGRWRDGVVVIASPTCPERLGESFTPPGAWQVGISPGAPGGIYDLSAQRDEVIRGFRRGARQSWFHDPAYRGEDEAGRPIAEDAANGGAPRIIRAGTINSYATGAGTLRAGASYRGTKRATIYTSLLDDGQPGDCLAPVDHSVTTPWMIVRGRNSGSFTRSLGTSLAAPQLARWLAGQMEDGLAPKTRQAIRALAQQQFGGQPNPPADPPVVQFPARFPEF